MKRFCSLLITTIITLVFCFLLRPAEAQAEQTFSGYRYVVSGGTATITYFDRNAYGNITIPEKMGKYPVTAIGEGAFSSCADITGITIPSGVTRIEDYAFYLCEKLAYVSIPNTVTAIGSLAFSHCSSLTGIVIPDSVSVIRAGTFLQCENLTSISIPESVTIIGAEAFWKCTSLTDITIPASVCEIGFQAFLECTALTNIDVDPGNTAYSSRDGVLFNKEQTTLITAPPGLSGGYTVPESVITVETEAFRDCAFLNSIAMSDNVTEIGDGAFMFCSGLTSVSLSNNLSTIGATAFGHCSSLRNIDIPKKVTRIDEQAFMDCDSLTSVKIPDGVTVIEKQTFTFCNNLQSITIPKSVIHIKGVGSAKHIIYEGTASDWKAIQIDVHERVLKDLTITYLGDIYLRDITIIITCSIAAVVLGIGTFVIIKKKRHTSSSCSDLQSTPDTPSNTD